MKIRKILIGVAAFALMLGTTLTPAFADSYAQNFETLSLGTINAQDGWSSLGAAGLGCAVYDHAVDSSFSTPNFGLKSLRISNSVVSGCFSDQTFSKSLNDDAGEAESISGGFSGGNRQPHFEAQFDLASASPAAQQPGLYMSVSPDRGDGARMSYLRFEDQADGVHVFFDDVSDPTLQINSDTFIETDIATIDRSIPHEIKFEMDFVQGPNNDLVNIYIDGVLTHTGTSWENYFRYDAEAFGNPQDSNLIGRSRPVDSLLFRTGGTPDINNAPATAGRGFLVDNLSFLSGPTPTPTPTPILVGPPTNMNQCKNDGWKTFNNPTFTNQGQCVSHVENSKTP